MSVSLPSEDTAVGSFLFADTLRSCLFAPYFLDKTNFCSSGQVQPCHFLPQIVLVTIDPLCPAIGPFFRAGLPLSFR